MGKVNFIIGRTGVGKSHQILTEITNKCAVDPLGAPIFVITPEQMTFHTEYQLLLMNPANSMIRANVVSFTRLARRLMQEVGGLAGHHLDEVGKAMLLQKVMMSQSEDLGIFANYIKKPGFIKKMDELFSEFKNYQLDTNALTAKLTTANVQPQMAQKLTTLTKLYESFNAITLSQYLTTEDYFTHLANLISESDLIKQSEIYIDGYHTFNAIERMIITQLAQHAKKVTVVLTVDPESTHNLWQTTMRTFSQLQVDLNHLKPHILPILTKDDRADSSEITTHLQSHFMQTGLPFKTKTSVENQIAFLSAPTRRLEIEAVASKIHKLAYEDQVAFSNIAIYTNDPVADQHLYQNIFAKYEIPHFLDAKVKMLTHPVISLLHKVFTIFETNWRPTAVLSVLKTGLFVETSNIASTVNYATLVNNHLEVVDKLENHVLANNIKKHDWLAGSFEDAELAAPLVELEANLMDATTTVAFLTATFTFLEQLEIPKKLQLMTDVAERLGDIQAKKQHEQVWSKLLSIFEQLVEVVGDEPLTLAEFSQILRTGLEQLTFATIPPALDAVQIGDITRSRYQLVPNFDTPETYGVEHVFIVGMNDGEIPATPAEASLLSEKERLILTSMDIELAPSLAMSQQDAVFSLYTILASRSKTITISYTHEETKHPSYIFTHVKQMFPDVKIQGFNQPGLYEDFTTKQVLFDQALQAIRTGSELVSYYQPVVEYFEKTDPIKHQILMSASGFNNQVTTLSPAQAVTVYGDEINASVSRLELFNKCEFAHFMRYGLKLRKRDLFELEISDIGTLYHEALRHISMLLQKEGRGFASLQNHEVKTLAKLGVDATLGKEKAFIILKSTPRMHELTNKLKNVVEKTIMALATQGKRSEFKESYFEMRFGKNGSIKTKPRQIGDVLLTLTGTIDRIDTGVTPDGKRYLRVVDYKSSKRALELDAVYHGQSMQLLTYLDVAISNLEGDYHNAGALYFHMHNPYTQVTDDILTKNAENLLATMQDAKSSDYRMDGYLPAEYEIATMSDVMLADGSVTRSDVVPISLKRDGTFAAVGNRTLAHDDFELLRTFTNQKIDDTVGAMVQGANQINPANHKNKSACDWCEFRAVCGFDKAYNKTRNLPKLKDEDVLLRMKGE